MRRLVSALGPVPNHLRNRFRIAAVWVFSCRRLLPGGGLQYRRPDRVFGICRSPAQDCSARVSCARKLFSCCCGILEIRFDQLTSSAKTICRRRVRQGLSGVQWNEDDRGAFASFSVGSKCRFDLADRESSELDRSHVGTSYSPTALLAVIFGLGSAFVRRRPRPR